MDSEIYFDMNIQSIWILQSSKYSNFLIYFCGKAERRECRVQENKTCQTCFKKHNYKHGRILCAHENVDIFHGKEKMQFP